MTNCIHFINFEKFSTACWAAVIIRTTPPDAPITFKRYVDDTYSRFNDIPSSETFLGILNSQEPRIQFTADYENDEKELNFLDVTVKNTKTNKFSFKVYRKDAITISIIIK